MGLGWRQRGLDQAVLARGSSGRRGRVQIEPTSAQPTLWWTNEDASKAQPGRPSAPPHRPTHRAPRIRRATCRLAAAEFLARCAISCGSLSRRAKNRVGRQRGRGEGVAEVRARQRTTRRKGRPSRPTTAHARHDGEGRSSLDNSSRMQEDVSMLDDRLAARALVV